MNLRSGRRRERVRGEARLWQFLPNGLRAVLVAVVSVTVFVVTLPSFYLLVWSLWGTDVVGRLREFQDPTWGWFISLLSTQEWRESLFFSTVVAFVATFLGTIILSIYNYSVRFAPAVVDILSFVIVSMALLTPPITYGLSLRSAGALFGFPEWFTLALGHLLVTLPLQFLVFEAARGSIPVETLWAARTLGASHWRCMVYIFLPNMWLPVIGALILGFFVSFDEIVVATFVLERAFITAPLRLWKGLSHQVTPDPAVVAVFLIVACIALALLYRWLEPLLSRREGRNP